MTGPTKAKRKPTQSSVRRDKADYEFDNIKDYVDDIIDQVEERLIAIEARQPDFRYRGVFQRAEEYRKSNVVTHGGSLWIALADAPGVPGAPEGAWQMAVKGGDTNKGKP